MSSDSAISPFAIIMKIGIYLEDSQVIRLQKSLLAAGSVIFIVSGALWGIAYVLLDEIVAGLVPLSYAIVSSMSLIHSSLTCRYHFFVSASWCRSWFCRCY